MDNQSLLRYLGTRRDAAYAWELWAGWSWYTFRGLFTGVNRVQKQLKFHVSFFSDEMWAMAAELSF